MVAVIRSDCKGWSDIAQVRVHGVLGEGQLDHFHMAYLRCPA